MEMSVAVLIGQILGLLFLVLIVYLIALVPISLNKIAARLSEIRDELSPPYSPPYLLRRRQAPHLRRFARSRVLTLQASTPPARSVPKRPSHGTWRYLVTEGW